MDGTGARLVAGLFYCKRESRSVANLVKEECLEV